MKKNLYFRFTKYINVTVFLVTMLLPGHVYAINIDSYFAWNFVDAPTGVLELREITYRGQSGVKVLQIPAFPGYSGMPDGYGLSGVPHFMIGGDGESTRNLGAGQALKIDWVPSYTSTPWGVYPFPTIGLTDIKVNALGIGIFEGSFLSSPGPIEPTGYYVVGLIPPNSSSSSEFNSLMNAPRGDIYNTLVWASGNPIGVAVAFSTPPGFEYLVGNVFGAFTFAAAQPDAYWKWPVDSFFITQPYAEYGEVQTGRFHVGIDLRPSTYPGFNGNYQDESNYQELVRPMAPGIVHNIKTIPDPRPNGWCSGEPDDENRIGGSGCPDHGLGNTVIIWHQSAGLYSLYAHLDSIDSSLFIGKSVTHDDVIGKMGHSGNGLRRNKCPEVSCPHVHLEVKDRGVISTGKTDDLGTYWGYIPGTDNSSLGMPGHPTWYGFHDPKAFVGASVTKLDRPVVIEALMAVDVRDNPSSNNSRVLTRIDTRPDGKFPRFVALRSVGNEWYQIYLPNAVNEGWSAAGWIPGSLNGIEYSRPAVQTDHIIIIAESTNVFSDTNQSQVLASVYGENKNDPQRFVTFETTPEGWQRIYVPEKAGGAIDGWLAPSAIKTPPAINIETPALQTNQGMLNTGESLMQTFFNTIIQRLKFVLGFGSEFNIKVYSPDGQLYQEKQSVVSPITIDIPDAQVGQWRFDVSAIETPIPNDPFKVVVSAPIIGDIDSDGDVDMNDLNILLADRNKSVSNSACGAICDLDKNGVITVLDARKLTTLCTRPRCAIQ